ncbi:hypothetical protein AJ79_05022 [Helicocarpus griseus UAMH5409]|uniref:Zn(2)-C6 fungal-type domain-containing protein n=1 Tax=Helicocarpus griseus UAMH5409 TaxID=1447875 RepID=A0A2B7XQD5_9EURO|nr:hypothetical protein AJ79_05022 [Helicocarpus griseus UAMH5409]
MQKSNQISSPIPLACRACRKKHLKCDGIHPVCGRCRKTRSFCEYTPSRRGYRSTPRPTITVKTSSTSTSPGSSGQPDQLPTPSNSFNFNNVVQTPEWASQDPSILQDSTSTESLEDSPLAFFDQGILQRNNLLSTPEDADARLVDFYYAFFHDSHPLLPPPHLLHFISPFPSCLKTVMKFIGAHFAFGVSTDAYKALAAKAIENDTEPSYQKVQALLLYATVLHARNDREEAIDSFITASTLAVELGMHRKSCVETLAGRNFVREETLRRTWWELYMTDVMFGAFDHCPMKFGNLAMDVQLPSEDISYSTGVCLVEPPTTVEFYNRVFSESHHKYSSFCYAVEATLLLKRGIILGATLEDNVRDQVESLEANIGSWFRHTPEDRPNALCIDGTVDQVLFRAYMLVHCASIYVHLPRSCLMASPTANATIACARRGTYLMPTSHTLTHASKALEAANGIVTLGSIRSPLLKHTPFFICGLVLGAVVQLCACSVNVGTSIEPRRDRLALIVGELKALDRTWALAHQVMWHIKMLAREVLEIGVLPISQTDAVQDPGPDVNALVSSDMWLGDIRMDPNM